MLLAGGRTRAGSYKVALYDHAFAASPSAALLKAAE
jgi:hypothetical protein